MGTAPRWVPLSQETRIEKLTHRQGGREKKQRRVRGREGRREGGGVGGREGEKEVNCVQRAERRKRGGDRGTEGQIDRGTEGEIWSGARSF